MLQLLALWTLNEDKRLGDGVNRWKNLLSMEVLSEIYHELLRVTGRRSSGRYRLIMSDAVPHPDHSMVAHQSHSGASGPL